MFHKFWYLRQHWSKIETINANFIHNFTFPKKLWALKEIRINSWLRECIWTRVFLLTSKKSLNASFALEKASGVLWLIYCWIFLSVSPILKSFSSARMSLITRSVYCKSIKIAYHLMRKIQLRIIDVINGYILNIKCVNW